MLLIAFIASFIVLLTALFLPLDDSGGEYAFGFALMFRTGATFLVLVAIWMAYFIVT